MRRIQLTQINQNIVKNRRSVGKEFNDERQKNPTHRSLKIRSKSKQDLLLEITKATIENARRQGKFRTTGKRKLYYDPS